MRGLLAGLTKEKGTTAIDSAYSVYTSHWGSAPEQAVVKKTVADIESDFLFLVPTQIALQLHANNSRSAPIGPTTRFYVSSWWQSVVFFLCHPLLCCRTDYTVLSPVEQKSKNTSKLHKIMKTVFLNGIYFKTDHSKHHITQHDSIDCKQLS